LVPSSSGQHPWFQEFPEFVTLWGSPVDKDTGLEHRRRGSVLAVQRITQTHDLGDYGALTTTFGSLNANPIVAGLRTVVDHPLTAAALAGD
jgi:hypothetical protein